MELLFGTCDNSSDAEQWELIPGTPADDPDDILFDFYFLHGVKPFYVDFSENQQSATWNLEIDTQCPLPCTLDFTLLSEFAPKQGSFLSLYQGETKLRDIVDKCSIDLDAHGQYTIQYIPAPEKSTVTADVTFTFQPGWNLLHLPIVVYSDQRRVGDNWDTLLNLPRMTLSGRTYVKGGEIRCGEAFWAFYDGRYAEENHTLTVLGYEPLFTDWPSRPTGWNFTGQPENTSVSTNRYEWKDGHYQILPTAANIDSKKGYWIKGAVPKSR